MAAIARFLAGEGFNVVNIGYPSTRLSIENLASHIHPQIQAICERSSEKVHFVGHSMGGLLIRAYLAAYRPVALGRVVMVGTPNQGSEVADFLKDWRIYRLLYGIAGQQLITDQRSFRHFFGEIDFELGVIAGNRSIDPISSRLIGKANDGKVSIDSTMIEGMADHCIVPASHTFITNNKMVQRNILEFLRNGKFSARVF